MKVVRGAAIESFKKDDQGRYLITITYEDGSKDEDITNEVARPILEESARYLGIESYRCSMCGKSATTESFVGFGGLPFRNDVHKIFYCGCRGWD